MSADGQGLLRVCVHRDAAAFLARAEPWLARSEIQHAMALQSARFCSADDSHFQTPLYWATLEERDQIVGCAFRTPPYRLGVTALPPAAVPLLVESVGAVYRSLAGVAGEEPTVSAFAAAWTATRGASWSVLARQHLLTHRAIVPAAEPPAGALRLATRSDRALAREWGAAFAYESGLPALDGALCVRLIPEQRLYLWDDGGRRCMLGVLRETANAAAVGVLYTPPQLRERGYATATVRAFSRHLLSRGLPYSYFCLEPSNAVAHSICSKLGYTIVQATADIDFAGEPP